MNFTGTDAGDKARQRYPPEIYARLQAMKDKYDPTNVFRFNQNIPPSPAAG